MFGKTTVLAVMLVVCITSVLQADLSDKDVQEANNYALTEKRIQQFWQATKNMYAATQKNPNLLGENNRRKIELEGLGGLEQAFEKLPEAKKAILDAGMSVREYWTFQIAMVYAAAGNLVLKSGGNLPPEYSKENVEFFRKHEADFKKLEKDLKALQGISDDEEEEEEEDNDEDEDEDEDADNIVLV